MCDVGCNVVMSVAGNDGCEGGKRFRNRGRSGAENANKLLDFRDVSAFPRERVQKSDITLIK